MSQYQVATRYARALFQLAEDQQCAEAVFGGMTDLLDLTRRNAAFADILRHAGLSIRQQRDVLEALLQGRVYPLVLRFLHFLATRRRLAALPEVCEAYIARYRDSRRQVRAEVVSALELRPDQVTLLCRKLEAKYQRQIEAVVSTDPSLLGGFIVRVRDDVHDYSIRGQLDALHTAITHA